MHDRGATSPVIAARAANTNTAVSRRTTQRRVPHGPKPQRKSLLGRPRPPPRRPHERQNHKRTSLGRRPLLVASSRARGRHERSVAVEQRPAFSAPLSLQRCSRGTGGDQGGARRQTALPRRRPHVAEGDHPVGGHGERSRPRNLERLLGGSGLRRAPGRRVSNFVGSQEEALSLMDGIIDKIAKTR